MKKIVIIGAGSMGSAFTLPCVDNRNRTFLIGTHLEDKLINNLLEEAIVALSRNLYMPLFIIDMMISIQTLLKGKKPET